MTARQEALLISLLSVAKKHKKFYCFVSQKRLEELLKDFHRMAISNRTLNRDLRWLEDNRFISRLRRIRKGVDGKPLFTSTLYKFTGKLFNWLNSIGNRVKRLFSWFRLPKMADYKLTQKQASCVGGLLSADWIPFSEKDGSAMAYNRLTGEVKVR